MQVDGAEFVVTPGELAALLVSLELEEKQLSVIPAELPTDDEEAAVGAGIAALSVEERDELIHLVTALAGPVRTLALGYSLADETVSRQLLVWPPESDGELVAPVRHGGSWRLGRRSTDAVRRLLVKVLATDTGVRADPLALGLTARAVVDLLAIIDWLRAARLFAELQHELPTTVFGAEAIRTRLDDATVDDFRWPLSFFDKFYPGDVGGLSSADVTRSLADLLDAELIEAADDDAGLLFTLTAVGEIVADAFFHEVSKVGMLVTECRPDGGLGHETVLLVRGVFHLLVFDVDGDHGTLAALTADQVDSFFTSIMIAPESERASVALHPLRLG